MHGQHRSLFAAIAAGKFTYLLVSMGLLVILSPFLAGIVWAELVTDIIFSALLVSAMLAVNRKEPLFMIEAVLAVLVFIARWWYHLTLDPNVSLFATATGSVFFVLIAISMIFHVFETTAVTGDTISGSVCAYLLLGIAWAYVFALLEALNPQTLHNLELAEDGPTGLEPFLYFSFVTLTTLGYGDIVPGTPGARVLASFEAITGQLFLTVLVARIVGLYGTVRTIRRSH